ncbi:glycosyltransferase family 4 protein [Sulfobacillus thermosulfidooxidans]|uniref:glycosyltransferase family 4 protein n=2 Tax=Sulfobacillus thermosulfidooxidans TaxID=28034 RepID=UPI000C1FC54F|nr:glycosyltransferase family 4 protein [Sulfobacillus thermosulfidooxidans]
MSKFITACINQPNNSDTQSGNLGGETTELMDFKPLRFIFLTQYYPPEPGAASLRLEAMAQELTRRGHSVSVVTALPHHLGTGAKRQPWMVREKIRGIEVVRMWIWRISPERRFWWRLLNYFSFVVTSFWGLRQFSPPDYLLVESPPLFLGITGRLYSKLYHVPYILSISDLWPESAVALGLVKNPWLIRLTKGLELSLYRHAHYVSTVTEGIRRAVMDTHTIEPSRVLFFPNGVNLDQFPALPAKASLRHKFGGAQAKIFLYPGTLGYAQGLDVIIDAAIRLRKEPDIVFVLVGEGPVKQHLLQRVQTEGLTNVFFEELQPVEKMPEYFAISRAVVVPLRKHPLFHGARPSKVFPAWSAKVPIIYVGEGEMAELVRKSEGGMVVPPEDGETLAQAVMHLAHMEEGLWKQMGQRGWQFVHDHYTWQHIADEWLKGIQPRPGL